ncbi:MAG TPA: GIY-YIG nuclease family protein [Acidobacteriaceae bacterium]|nr:GIY-YIG nuclease family protein [Acidobacteriaceae bacterium]
MPAKKATKYRRAKKKPLIAGHLSGIKRALLEGEKRAAFLAFLDEHLPVKQGIYALYDKRGRLYYAGKASDLPRRLNQHLRDRHGDSWDRMTLFHVANSANVGELEGLVVATARPPGNKQRPRIGQDLRKQLSTYLKRDAVDQITQAIYPERPHKQDALSKHITLKKLHSVGQARLGKVLGISQPRVSGLMRNGEIKRYIREAGKRDAVLTLLEKVRRD